MSIDIEQFHQTFFDESSEHLDDMERLLMALDLDAPDDEDVNCIFRAAHSIKGGSGIFGFDALTGLTHVMENLLDDARKGQLKFTTSIVDTLLDTVDVLKHILASYQQHQPIPQQEMDVVFSRLLEILQDTHPDEVEALRHENDKQHTQTEAEADDDFGFFDLEDDYEESKPAESDDSFGFFDDDAEEKVSDNVKDDFGFFEAVPVQNAIAPEYGFHKSIEQVRKDAKENKPAETPIQDNTKASSKPTSIKTGKDSTTIRVDTAKVDAMVNLVGELVITQSMLSMISDEVEGSTGDKLMTAITELQRNTREIQESVMAMRMLPINNTFNRFPRVVRDLSSKLGKKVNLVIEGGATEIDKSMIEKLVDPLTHLVRNSIDHGVESPEERLEAGKGEEGQVILRAEQKGSSIIVSIVDDGAGLDRDRILAKAAENGLQADDNMKDSDVWQLIFQPGFSTAAEVTDVSGRGVGMDVVRRNIESIGGKIEIESQPGLGSAFYIHLPLTLAIVDGMCVSVGDQIFVVPLVNIIESIQPTKAHIKTIGNDTLLRIRDQYWPLVAIHDAMQIDDAITQPTEGIIVLLESSKKRFGILVDSLVGQQQVVIKSLEQHYRKVPGLSGATIMGDGRVAMIVDADALAVLTPSIEQEENVA